MFNFNLINYHFLFQIQLEVLVKSEVVELGGIVELVVKAEPFTNVYLLTVSDPLVFEAKEQELRKLTVSLLEKYKSSTIH